MENKEAAARVKEALNNKIEEKIKERNKIIRERNKARCSNATDEELYRETVEGVFNPRNF